MAGQVVVDDRGATLGQLLVVRVRALRIGVAGHGHMHLRVTLQGVNGLVQHRDRVGRRLGERLGDVGFTRLRTIELEVHATQVDHHLLRAAIRAHDGAGSGSRALVLAIVHAILIAVLGRAIGRRGSNRCRCRRGRGGRRTEARGDGQAEEPVTVAAVGWMSVLVPVETVARFEPDVGAVGDHLGHAGTQLRSRRPAIVQLVLVVAAHHANHAVGAPCIPVTGIEPGSRTDIGAGPGIAAETATEGRTVVHLALRAVNEEIERHVGREEATETQAVVDLAAVGIALVVIDVAAHRWRDIPAPVIGRDGFTARGISRRRSRVLCMNGTYAAQGERDQEIQALTFHQVSPRLLKFESVRPIPESRTSELW